MLLFAHAAFICDLVTDSLDYFWRFFCHWTFSMLHANTLLILMLL